jgi:hypothetical protein
VGEGTLCDTPRSARPLTATDESFQEYVEEMIGENHCIKQKDIAHKLGIPKERVATLSTFLDSKNFVPGGSLKNLLMK